MRDLEEWDCSIHEKSIYGDEKVRIFLTAKFKLKDFHL